MKKAFVVLIGLTMAFLTACSTETKGSDARILRLATDLSADYPTTIALEKFANEVKEKSNGRLNVEIYAGAQLGDENSYLQQLQFGAIDFAKSSVASLAQFCSELNALSLPYLFDSEEHMMKVLDGEAGQEIFKNFEKYNIVGLGYANNGSRCFFSKKPIKSVGDLENMKIRVQSSEMMLGMVECLGGFPQSIASTEVYSALQTGVVEGAENNINVYLNESYYEQAPYWIDDCHNIQPEIIIASKVTWDTLPEDDKIIIREAMKNAMEEQRILWKEREKQSKEKLLEAGVTIYEPTEEQRLAFREKCQAVYEDLELGQPYTEFVKKVREVR